MVHAFFFFPVFIFLRKKKYFCKKVSLDFSVCYANIFIEKAAAKGGSPIKTNEAHWISPSGHSRGAGKIYFILSVRAELETKAWKFNTSTYRIIKAVV